MLWFLIYFLVGAIWYVWESIRYEQYLNSGLAEDFIQEFGKDKLREIYMRTQILECFFWPIFLPYMAFDMARLYWSNR